MQLDSVQLPLAAVSVVNTQLIPETLTVMCAGTERFSFACSEPELPNPVVPGYYGSTEGGATFSASAYNNLMVLTVGNISGLPGSLVSFNCTSLESSAFAKLFVTNRE